MYYKVSFETSRVGSETLSISFCPPLGGTITILGYEYPLWKREIVLKEKWNILRDKVNIDMYQIMVSCKRKTIDVDQIMVSCRCKTIDVDQVMASCRCETIDADQIMASDKRKAIDEYQITVSCRRKTIEICAKISELPVC